MLLKQPRQAQQEMALMRLSLLLLLLLGWWVAGVAAPVQEASRTMYPGPRHVATTWAHSHVDSNDEIGAH